MRGMARQNGLLEHGEHACVGILQDQISLY